MTPVTTPRARAATRSQVRGWFQEHIAAIPATRVAFAGLTRTAIPAEALASAMTDLSGRHPALRSTFRRNGYRLERAELAAAAVPTAWLRPRLARLPASLTPGSDVDLDLTASGAGVLAGLLDEEHDRSFDLTAGPLFRVTAADCGDAQVLSMVLHGSVCDRPALHLLAAELVGEAGLARGGGFTGAAGQAVPAVPALVAAYAEPFSDYLARRHQDFTDPCQVPVRAMPAAADIPAPLRDRVERSAARLGTEATTVVLAALALALARHRGLTEVCLGVHPQPDGQVTGAHSSDDPVPVLIVPVDSGRAEVLVSQVDAQLRRARAAEFPRLSTVADVLSLPAALAPAIPVDGRCSVITVPAPASFVRMVTPVPVGAVPELDVHWPEGTGRARIEVIAGGGPGQPDASESLVREVITALRWLSDQQQPGRATRQLIPAGDRQRVAEWSAGPPCTDREAERVHELFERRAAQVPQRLAVAAGDARLTYRELDERASELASFLASHLRPAVEAGRGAVVAVAAERTAHLVTALLAAWKCGAAYLPLDPATPAARVESLVREAGAEVLLAPTASAFGEMTGVTTVALTEFFAGGRTASTAPPWMPPAADALAYVIFTSGSSGRPKAVAVPHSAVLDLLAAMDAQLSPDVRPCWLATTNVSFDISVVELFWTLTRGGTVYLATDGYPNHLADLASEATTPVTHYQATPSLLAAAMDDAGFRRALAGVLTLTSAGEPLSRDLADRLLGCLRDGRLINAYGPTETTVYATCATVAPGQGPVTIGRPLAGVTIWILDACGDPVPPGLIGELCIGGSTVAWGYLGQGGLTAARFRPDPFSSIPGARLYWTGDMVRYTFDGEVEYLGRRDRQVKIRGYRVEPGELESVLRRCAGIRSAAVVAREDRPGERRLVGYVVPADLSGDPAVVERTLLGEARAQLPDYLVPSRIVVLAELPLTPSGKLDQARLPVPGPRKPGTGFGACVTAVTRCWAHVLGCPVGELTPDTAPYHRGATLVHAADVHRELDLEYPSLISPGDVAAALTLRELALLIDDRRRHREDGEDRGGRP